MGQTDTELPATMSAAVYHSPGVVVVEDRPVPATGPDQVLVEVDHCGICGSDIHMLRDGWGNNPGLIAGHEWTGVIASLGPGVEGWQVGDSVVCGSSPRCGACRRCLEGQPSQCENRSSSITDSNDGAFARYVVVPTVSLLRLPQGLSSRHAALAEPLAVALHGITRSDITSDDSAMVIGNGPIGALTVAALRARGITDVTVVEPSSKRQELARQLGATSVLDPKDLPLFPQWEPEKIAPNAVHVVFECSGKKAAMEAGFNQLRRGGVLVLVGAGVEAPTFDPNRMILNELTVRGSFVYDLGGFERALELLASGLLPNELLIESDDVPLSGISQALEALATGQIRGKVMVAPGLTDGSPEDAKGSGR
jgi:2-desacetyl-2-hydroxyethyl bacteriochlorophyllide A dehydrogenase